MIAFALDATGNYRPDQLDAILADIRKRAGEGDIAFSFDTTIRGECPAQTPEAILMGSGGGAMVGTAIEHAFWKGCAEIVVYSDGYWGDKDPDTMGLKVYQVLIGQGPFYCTFTWLGHIE